MNQDIEHNFSNQAHKSFFTRSPFFLSICESRICFPLIISHQYLLKYDRLTAKRRHFKKRGKKRRGCFLKKLSHWGGSLPLSFPWSRYHCVVGKAASTVKTNTVLNKKKSYYSFMTGFLSGAIISSIQKGL